ncbi:hypothetical protein QOZ80_5BG0438530 [Eleusine coracana subsp. coracana]|nr:hypothetical protein QOZ80_5BG0438530 [Eleusine coracana subsp. coracana]
MRMKCVSKDACEQISEDAMFAAKQSTLCPSCPAIIYVGRSKKDCSEYFMDILSSTPSTVGAPSSRLNFLSGSIDSKHFFLLSSSNGLICICCKPYHIGPSTPPNTFFIVNPATQQAQSIPGAAQHLVWKKALGLVFDPCAQPTTNTHKFQIIDAVPITATHDTFLEFRFLIFSSDTGRWIMSDITLNAAIKKCNCDKVVYTCGVIYWDYVENLLWFDATRNVAGVLKIPNKLQESTREEREGHSIDVSDNGMLMCTIINKDGLAMYELVIKGERCWELKHEKGWKEIMDISSDAFGFCHSMKLRNAWQSKFYEKWFVRPLGLESSRWVYLGVRLRYKTSDRVLRYDLKTSKMEDTGKELGNAYEMNCAFGYRNSMVALPPIAIPISEDGICDGNPGGCICAPEEN